MTFRLQLAFYVSVPIYDTMCIPFQNAKWKPLEMTQMLEVLANYVATRKTGRNGKTYESPRIYLPTKLTCDSCFPFAGGTVRVRVRVDGRRLIVESASKRDMERFGEAPARKRKRRRRR